MTSAAPASTRQLPMVTVHPDLRLLRRRWSYSYMGGPMGSPTVPGGGSHCAPGGPRFTAPAAVVVSSGARPATRTRGTVGLRNPRGPWSYAGGYPGSSNSAGSEADGRAGGGTPTKSAPAAVSSLPRRVRARKPIWRR